MCSRCVPEFFRLSAGGVFRRGLPHSILFSPFLQVFRGDPHVSYAWRMGYKALEELSISTDREVFVCALAPFVRRLLSFTGITVQQHLQCYNITDSTSALAGTLRAAKEVCLDGLPRDGRRKWITAHAALTARIFPDTGPGAAKARHGQNWVFCWAISGLVSALCRLAQSSF